MSTQTPDKKKTPLKWRLLTIAPPILLLAGILVLLYPVFATQYNNQRQERIASQFSAVAENVGPDAVAESLRRADEYNLRASESPILDPWLDAQRPGTAQYQDYLSQLNLNEVMATIKIPSINVNLPIYHGTENADEAASTEEGPVEEGDDEGRDQRQDDKEEEARHPGREIDEGAQAIAPPTLSARRRFVALGGLRLPRVRRARRRLAAGLYSVNAHELCTPFRRMSVGSSVALTPPLALT